MSLCGHYWNRPVLLLQGIPARSVAGQHLEAEHISVPWAGGEGPLSTGLLHGGLVPPQLHEEVSHYQGTLQPHM